MLISRGVSTLRALKGLQNVYFKPSVRNGGHHASWNYRKGMIPPRADMIAMEIAGGFAWWWILWHLWTEPGHVVGEFEYPDARKWTDEELGIPEDIEVE